MAEPGRARTHACPITPSIGDERREYRLGAGARMARHSRGRTPHGGT